MTTKTTYIITKPTSAVFRKISYSYPLKTDLDPFLGTVVHIKNPQMYQDINFENVNEVLIFVTREQLENSLDWYCYMDIAIDLLMQETDSDYKMIKSKTGRTTLVFDSETFRLYCQQQRRDINEFVNKDGNSGDKFIASTLNDKLTWFLSLGCDGCHAISEFYDQPHA